MNNERTTPPTMEHPASRVGEYFSLTKPRLTLLSVLTAVGSTYLASGENFHFLLIVHTFVGTWLVGGAAGTLNQYAERLLDAVMKRTRNRQLPAQRIEPHKALWFGIILALLGVLYLAVATNLWAAGTGLLTLLLYLLLYTPMKRKTPFATILGGIPGALPTLIGWAVGRGAITIEAWSLFFILFFWQMPHFLALAWIYRVDYARADHKILTVVDPSGIVASRQMLIYAVALFPAALMPTLVGLLGIVYFIGAAVFTSIFLWIAFRHYRDRSNESAKLLFTFSLIYLSALMSLMVLDRIL
ncbi:MAG: heme o synthase [bacterium]